MSIIETKAVAGHPYILRNMSGEIVIALYHGVGQCSSTFQAVEAIHGPAQPFGRVK